MLGALGTETTRPSSAAQCVAYIAVIELPHNQWTDVIQMLVGNVTGHSGSLQSSELLKEASLEAIGYVCADIVITYKTCTIVVAFIWKKFETSDASIVFKFRNLRCWLGKVIKFLPRLYME